MLELSFQSISWIWALNFFVDPQAAGETSRTDDRSSESPWTVDLLLALDRQLTHIEHNLSHYFSPNTHLLGEALALYVAGRAVPELARAARRESIGRRILVEQIDRQIERDGGHAERSTHYHRYTLDFYLLALAVARITGDSAAPTFGRAANVLASAARLFADDRGRVAHIGDDDGGATMPMTGRAPDDWRDTLATAAALLARPELRVGPPPEEPIWLLADPKLAPLLDASNEAPVAAGARSAALPDTGYYVSRSPAGDHLVIDGGPHGYRNGGHAHADALSLAFTLNGAPLLIDPGTGCYTIDPALRNRMRSTALHNTLQLDGRDQSVPRGPFHWTTVANGSVHCWRTNGGFDYFEGTHDGYRPLEHRRHVLALHGDLLVVADFVSGPETDREAHTGTVHWHIDPSWHVNVTSHGARLIGAGDVSLHVSHGSTQRFAGDVETGLGWHAPIYGQLQPATTIRIVHEAALPFWIVSVFGLNPGNPVSGVVTLPVWAEAGVLVRSTALRITRQTSIDYLIVAEPAEWSASARSTWRVAEFETDARMLFCRAADDQRVTHITMVDGSMLRSSSRNAVMLALPNRLPDLHLDLRHLGTGDRSGSTEGALSGLGPGATLIVGGTC